MTAARRKVPRMRDSEPPADAAPAGCDSLEIWRGEAALSSARRGRSGTMDLDIVTYVFQGPQGTFSIKPRLSRRWRVKQNSTPWGDSFGSAEEAALALSREFDVPSDLKEWTEVGDFHSDVGGLMP